MAGPLRGRMPNPSGANPPVLERKVNGWTLQVIGKEVGVMISPSGKTMTMRFNAYTGVSTLCNEAPILDGEAVETMDRMLRNR